MNSAIRIAMVALFFCLAAALPAGGKKETPVQEEKSTLVQVSGIVRLVGNEPFTSLVISGTESEWYIDEEDRYKLKDLQHRAVKVEGAETVKEFTFPNGLLTGERRTLRNIKIIAVE